jgi:transcriptional regulator of met regulon
MRHENLLPEETSQMTAITVQLSDDMAEDLRRLAAAQERSETEIVCEALIAYVQTARPLPKGMGKFRSGKGDVSEQARDLIRQAVKEDQWP